MHIRCFLNTSCSLFICSFLYTHLQYGCFLLPVHLPLIAHLSLLHVCSSIHSNYSLSIAPLQFTIPSSILACFWLCANSLLNTFFFLFTYCSLPHVVRSALTAQCTLVHFPPLLISLPFSTTFKSITHCHFYISLLSFIFSAHISSPFFTLFSFSFLIFPYMVALMFGPLL